MPVQFQSPTEKTLQSIDNTLKRIELILLLVAKSQYAVWDDRTLLAQMLEESLADLRVE